MTSAVGDDTVLAAIERRFDGLERRLAALDEKLSRQFVWLITLQVTILVASVGALLTRT